MTLSPLRRVSSAIISLSKDISEISKLIYSALIFSDSNFSLKKVFEKECMSGYPINP